jgi:hypothetical protein
MEESGSGSGAGSVQINYDSASRSRIWITDINYKECKSFVTGTNKDTERYLVRPSGIRFLLPPKSRQAMAFLMSVDPKIEGAMDLAIRSYISGSLAILLNFSSSSELKVMFPAARPGPSVST